MKITIAIADDHQLFLKSVGLLIENFENFEILAEALNGESLLHKLQGLTELPDIILIDVNMPVLNGAATAARISEKYPQVKLVALSMKDDDASVLDMIRAGCCAYLLKDMHPNDLERALIEIHNTGYYNADRSNTRFRKLLNSRHNHEKILLSEREKVFLQLSCSDLTYKQIADRMHLAERTIDGYRESLFQKLNVQSRVGMVLEALRRNLVSLELN